MQNQIKGKQNKTKLIKKGDNFVKHLIQGNDSPADSKVKF